MKIVCEACQAKYSISDDKVQGKVFKIRCKKCSNVIVVRGGAGAPEPAAEAEARDELRGNGAREKDTRVYDYDAGAAQPPLAEDAVWHLVIQQEQVGPMTAADVEQRFAAGEIDAETFVWREGFADWTPLAQVDTFASLASSAAANEALPGAGAAAISAAFGGMDHTAAPAGNDVSDLFAPPTAAPAPGPASVDDDGSDLFAPTPAAAAAAATAHKLRGERNENSVLFSLNNLAQLASDRPMGGAASPAGFGASAPSSTAGAASGEGSGLIDIRSMASAYLGSSPGAAAGKPATSSAIGSIDDLPVFGTGGFSEPAVIMPTVQRPTNNKLMWMMMSAVGVLALISVVMVVLLVKGGKQTVVVAEGAANSAADSKSGDDVRDGKSDTEPNAAATDSPDASGSSGDAKKPSGGTDPESGSDTSKPSSSAAASDSGSEVDKPDTLKKPSTRTGGSTTRAGTGTASTSKPATTTRADTPPKADSGSCDEVSCVLNNYEGSCCSKFRKSGGSRSSGGATKSSGGNLPDALDRAMISTAIAAVKPRVTACGDRSSAKGNVKVHVKVGGDGRVSNVSVQTTPDASLGSCVAAAVKRASFAKTERGGSFSYPFVF